MRASYVNRYPPQRCSLCARHISELQPFEEEIFEGKKLIYTYKVLVPYNQEMEGILKEVSYRSQCKDRLCIYSKPIYNGLWGCENIEALITKYGREKMHQAFVYDLMADSVVVFFQCRDCLDLENKRFAR